MNPNNLVLSKKEILESWGSSVLIVGMTALNGCA